MATGRLRTRLRDLPGMAIVDLSGDVDVFGEQALEAAYRQTAKKAPGAILFNFAGVDYINSKGIALFITLLMRARESGRELFASGLSDHYVDIFEITRLSDFIHVVPDEEAALAALARPS